MRQFAKGAANGGQLRELADALQGRGNDQREQRPRNPLQQGHPPGQQDQRQRPETEHRGHQVQLRQAVNQRPEFFMKIMPLHRRQAEKGLPLADPDDDADSRRETENHRQRDVTDHPAQPRQAKRAQHQARHQGGQLQAGYPMFRHDAGQNDDEGAGRTRDLDPAAATQGHHDTGHDGGIQPLFGLDPGSNRKGHGQRQGHDPDNQARNDIACPMAWRP